MKRYDNFSNESNTEADSYLELDNRVTISEPSDPNSEYRSDEITNDEKTRIHVFGRRGIIRPPIYGRL